MSNGNGECDVTKNPILRGNAPFGSVFAVVPRHQRQSATIAAKRWDKAFILLEALAEGIHKAESARGEIARADRFALAPEAKRFPDFIDRILYRMAGLTDAEARGMPGGDVVSAIGDVMNFQELSDLASGGETEGVEFKKTTGQRSEGMRTVCAMLNGAGGFVLFGITAAGKIGGQIVTSHTLEEVHNELRKIEPPAFPDVETVAAGGGNSIVAVRVPSGGGPYAYSGRPYMRNGPTTIIMPQAIYERKLLERSHATNRWENQGAEGVTSDDLDRAEVTRTVDEGIRRGRMEDPGTRNRHDLLARRTPLGTLDAQRYTGLTCIDVVKRAVPVLSQMIVENERRA
jgi:Putative DNA-binding domain